MDNDPCYLKRYVYDPTISEPGMWRKYFYKQTMNQKKRYIDTIQSDKGIYNLYAHAIGSI